MPEILQAALLGLVQGLTEFLPISSTAHLTLVPWLLGWESPLLHSLTFDVALHMGTLLAVLVFFWRDWIKLAAGFLRTLTARRLVDPWGRLAWLIILGTVPAVIAALLLEEQIETVFRTPLLIAVVLAVFSGVMWYAERVATQKRSVDGITTRDAILIGTAQAIALIPGVSRSGATISAGLGLGLDRAGAARFSFLLATPAVAGAGVKQAFDLRNEVVAPSDITLMVVGAAVAGISGWLCIKWLLAYLARDSLGVFVVYRLLLAAVLVIVVVVRGG